ncbi:SEC-C domain-containing protein [Pseudonocardia sp.]|uniref:SEC-C domain-containing protein n=1 Tax=Pseudonocardia sp. TaxID=60912 RepID=UPI00260C1C85|nr:SEC-C domain-containing protein [Pseudonocardia sp.]
MNKSRQRVLARPRRSAPPVPRPAAEEVAAAYLEAVRRHVAIGADELEAQLAGRFGLAVDDDLILEAADEVSEDPYSECTLLAGDVLVHAPGLMSGAVLTHRLSAGEQAGGFLVVDTDLAGFLRVSGPTVAEEPLEVDEHDGHLVWIGDEDWFADLPAGALLAVRVTLDGAVTLDPLDADPAVPPGLLERLRDRYEAELAEPGLPVPAEALLLGVRLADRDAFGEPVPPLEDLATAAGLERRGDEFAHAEPVWAAGAEARRHARLIARLGPGGEATVALEALDLLEDPDVDAAGLRRALDLLVAPDAVEAVTEELLGPDDDPAALVAVADRLVAVAGRATRAAVARWMATVAAERDGRVLDAESHLRAACVDAPGWEFVEDRLAWYEADRGDAAAATGRWRAIGVAGDHPDLAFAARFAAGSGPEPGRNDPCRCGSGRKYKQCHLGRAATAPLPERADWLWRKSVAYLERYGRAAEETMIDCALARAGAGGDLEQAITDPLTVDVVLHEQGWFARFLRDRGPLLPDDEALLGASWTAVDRTVYEVLAVRPGEGFDLRDLRTGDTPTVTERTTSRTVPAGTRLCARVAPDGGAGHRFVGGVLEVPPGREGGLLALLEEGTGEDLLGWAAARDAPPRPLGPAGADLRECVARLQVADGAADVLDVEYTPAGDGWVRLDADDRVLAALELADDVLIVRTLTAPRMDDVLADLRVVLPEGRVLSDERSPVAPPTSDLRT